MRAYGKTVWLIGDGFYSSVSTGGEISHESVCVLNSGNNDAHIRVSLLFEDRAPMQGYVFCVPAQRCLHQRTSSFDFNGEKLPMDVPYALLLESDEPVVVQYSRMDTRQAACSFMTTMAYPV